MGIILNLADRFAEAPALTKAPPPGGGEIGRSGTVETRGFIQDDESNPNLQWPLNLEQYDIMARTDPSVRWMLALVTTPIRAANWTIETASDNPVAQEAAAFLEYALFKRLEGGFSEFLRQALDHLKYGHSVFEVVAALEYAEFTHEVGSSAKTTKEVTRDAFIIHRLAPRLPRTIIRWISEDDDPSKLKAIEQQLTSQGPVRVEIEADRLVIFTNDKRGDDWRGESLLRSVYGSYKYKTQLQNLEALAYERAVGLPVVYQPEQVPTAQQLDEVEQGVRSLRQSESLYMIMPGPKAGTTPEGDGWLIESFGVDAQTHSAQEAIARHEAAMARNVLAEFMRLGHEQTGARATAETQEHAYWQAISAYVTQVEAAIQSQVIQRLLDWNYPQLKGDDIPQIKARDLEVKDKQAMIAGLSTLAQNAVVSVDESLEDWARELLGAPEKPDEPTGAQPPPPPPEPTKPDDKAEPQAFNQAMPSRFDMLNLTVNEQAVAFAEIEAVLNRAQDELVNAVDQVAAPLVAAMEQQAELAVENKQSEIISTLAIPSQPIAAAIEDVLLGLYDRGRRDIRSEINLQKKGTMFAEQQTVEAKLQSIKTQAEIAGVAIAAQGTRAIKAAALAALDTGQRVTGPGFNAAASIRAESGRAAKGILSAALNKGRGTEIQAQGIEEVQYSAVLDQNSCGPCQEADGEIGPIDTITPVPNPDCEGGGACRCIWVGVAQ